MWTIRVYEGCEDSVPPIVRMRLDANTMHDAWKIYDALAAGLSSAYRVTIGQATGVTTEEFIAGQWGKQG